MSQTPPHRDADFLVLTEGADMPPRCPLCNSPDVAAPLLVRLSVKRKGGLIGKAVSDAIDHLKGWNYTGPVTVSIPFCRRHRARRAWAISIGLALTLIGAVATPWVILTRTTGVLNVLAFAPLVIGLIVTLSTLTGVLNLWFTPRGFDDRTVWVLGASDEYLKSLEQPPSPSCVSPVPADSVSKTR